MRKNCVVGAVGILRSGFAAGTLAAALAGAVSVQGCATGTPAAPAVAADAHEKTREPVSPRRNERGGPDFRALELLINSGNTREVKVPRALLRDWLKMEKARAAECRTTGEQLEALKALDLEQWNRGTKGVMAGNGEEKNTSR